MNALNSTHFSVRIAQLEDVEQLVQLSKSLHRDQVTSTQYGFLRVAYSAEIFSALIKQDQVVIGLAGNEVVGYYLLNTASSDGTPTKHYHIVEEMKRLGKVPASVRVGVGAQACIHPFYQGKGLRPQMLQFLIKQLVGRYDYAFSTISKENPRAFKAHAKDGWQLFGEEEHYYYVVLPIPSV
jgi:GNAT superfamily N-acetyltransferase